MNKPSIIPTLVLSAVLAFGVSWYQGTRQGATQAPKETAFQRVMRTNTLRCGYVVLPPQLARDPNTGKLSGISYDLMSEIGKRLNLNIDWAEEINFATMTEGFTTGRYDAFCFSSYRWIPSARAMDFSIPIFYSRTDAYVRADDHRFDGSLQALNAPTVTVATIDGEAAQTIAATQFPNAKTTSMPQNSDLSLMFEAIKTKRADVAFTNPLVIAPYLKNNPNTLRRLTGVKPIQVYTHSLGFGKGEYDLVSTINLVLEDMRNDGTIDKILDQIDDPTAETRAFVRIKPAVE